MLFGLGEEIAYFMLLIIMIMLSFFFSASETAYMRTNRFRIRHLSEKGRPDAKRVELILKDMNRLLSSILLGNNFVNILASAIATAIFISVFGEQGIIFATIAMTIILLIFAEIVPKTIAAYRADEISMLFSYPLKVFIQVLNPLARLLSTISGWFLSLFGFKMERTDDLTEEDVGSVITMGQREGFIKKPKAKMLIAIMSMDTVPVKKIMLPLNEMEFISIDSTFDEIVKTITEKNYSRYPVYDGRRDNILGYLHIRDMWMFINNRKDFKLRDYLKEALFVPETKSLLKQLIDFLQMHIHMAFVVDEYGTVKGGIALEDIIEEITGDITDEHDSIITRIVPVGDKSFIVKGNTSLRDLEKSIGKHFPEDFDTLSGLIYSLFDRIPKDGEEVTWQDMQLKVEHMHGNRISRVRINIQDLK